MKKIWLCIVLGAVGCERAVQPVALTSERALTENALTENALTENALTENALTENALTENALTENALTENALTENALQDPNARLFLKYLIIVAFRPDQCETFGWADPQTGTNPAVYCGRLGLCPQWRDGGIKNDVPCQEWVTAGLLAHLNAFGVKVPFSARGPATSLLTVSEYEEHAFRYREGAFWGNFFKQPRELYAASDVRNVEKAKLNRRVCATSAGTCATSVIGPVDAHAVAFDTAQGWACETTTSSFTWKHSLGDPVLFFEADPQDVTQLHATGDQVASDCHPYLTTPSYTPTAEEIAKTTPRAVTTYLQESGMKLLHGCSPTMFPSPTGPCQTTRTSECDHPGDPCCVAADGTKSCQNWTLNDGRSFHQVCVNDQVAVGGQASYTCKPVP